MYIKKIAFAAALLAVITACERNDSAVQTSEATPPPPQPVATPAKPEVDYPGSIDIFSKVAGGKGAAIALVSGQTISGKYTVERDGNVVAFGVRIGTYRGTADGSLQLLLCSGDECAEASKSVVDAADNDYLVFELPSPLAVAAGATLDYTVTRSADATKRVAIWSYPKREEQTGLVDPSGTTIPMVPRLSIHLQ